MRTTLVTAALLGGMLVTTAAPATAAAPVREKQSGDFTSLESVSSECTPEGDGQTCTDIFLFARTDTEGQASVSLGIETYSLSADDEFTPISSEFGFTEEAVDLSVTGDFDATLSPTAIMLETFTCTPDGCQEGDSREVVVSAFDSAVGPAVSRRERGSFREGGCTFTFSSRSTVAPVEGTITIDGETYDETGSAELGKYRVTSRCK